jgi:hypothetical protein
MPMLQRTPRKLLRQVANRPHAVDNSHNETAGIPSNPEKPTVDLAADPVSSSDEQAPILSSSPPPALYEPPTRYGGRRVGIPKRGVFSSNTARKEQKSAEDGAKGIDNRGSGLPEEKSAGGTDSYDGSGGLDDFGEMAGPPSKKRKQNYTANVHASARPTMLGSFSKKYGRESTSGRPYKTRMNLGSAILIPNYVQVLSNHLRSLSQKRRSQPASKSRIPIH